MSLHRKLLYHSPGVSICDVCCRPEFRERGPEEHADKRLVVFPRSGVFLKQVAGNEFVVDPNHVAFFNEGESYRFAHPVGSGDDCTTFEFRTEALQEVIGAFSPAAMERPHRLFEFTHVLSNQRVFVFQQRLRRQLLSGVADALMIEESSLDLLAGVVRNAYLDRGIRPMRRRAATRQAHREQSEKTRLFLADRFSENLSLGDIARAVHSSTFHLARIFHRETGMTIHQYRNDLRLRAALERVVEGQADLTALALDLGFSSHSHFSDAFHRAFGIPPSECRRSTSLKWLREMSKILKAGRHALT